VPIIVGIDGTGGGANPGPGRDARYDQEMRGSFVSRIVAEGGAHTRYFRGPATFGGGLVDAISQGFEFIKFKKRAHPNESVLLTGYSRGAAGVVSLASTLQDARIDVRAIMLFDCVDRHVVVDAEIIPSNVGFVHHVIRDPRSESRESFGNDGLSYRRPTVYPAAYKFLCTHGGMGGVPWRPGPGQSMSDFVDEGFPDGITTISFEKDAQVSTRVWNFCVPFLQTHGFR
jgi:hypothetical protein